MEICHPLLYFSNKTILQWLTSPSALAWYKFLPPGTGQQKYLLITKLITAISNEYPIPTSFKLRICALRVFQVYDDQLYKIVDSNLVSLADGKMTASDITEHFGSDLTQLYKENDQFHQKQGFSRLYKRFLSLAKTAGDGNIINSPSSILPNGTSRPSSPTSITSKPDINSSERLQMTQLSKILEAIDSDDYGLLQQLLPTTSQKANSSVLEKLSQKLKAAPTSQATVPWETLLSIYETLQSACNEFHDDAGLLHISNNLLALGIQVSSDSKTEGCDIVTFWTASLDVQFKACEMSSPSLIPTMTESLVTKCERLVLVMSSNGLHSEALDYLSRAFEFIINARKLQARLIFETVSDNISDHYLQRLIDSASRLLLQKPNLDLKSKIELANSAELLRCVLSNIKKSSKETDRQSLAINIANAIWQGKPFDMYSHLVLRTCYTYFCTTGKLFDPVFELTQDIVSLDLSALASTIKQQSVHSECSLLFSKAFNLYSIAVTKADQMPFKSFLQILQTVVLCLGNAFPRAEQLLIPEGLVMIRALCKFLNLHTLHQLKISLLKQVKSSLKEVEDCRFCNLELAKSYHQLGFSGISVRILEPLLGLEPENSTANDTLHAQTLIEYALALLSSGDISAAQQAFVKLVDYIQASDCINVPLSSGKQKNESVGQFIERAILFGKAHICCAALENNEGRREFTIASLQKAIVIVKSLLSKVDSSKYCIWPLISVLIDSLSQISREYESLGVAKEAKYYVGEAIKLAQASHCTWRLIGLLSFDGEISIKMGELEESQRILRECEELLDGSQLNDINFLELIFSLSLFLQRQCLFEEEKVYYDMTDSLLPEILGDSDGDQVEIITRGVMKLNVSSATKRPAMTSNSLRILSPGINAMQNRLRRNQFFSLGLQNSHDEAVEILENNYHLDSPREIALFNICRARYNFLVAKQSLTIDPVFGVLQDSALSVPSVLPKSGRNSAGSINYKEVLTLLIQARELVLGQLEVLQDCSISEISTAINLLNDLNVLLGALSSSHVEIDDYLHLEAMRSRSNLVDRLAAQLKNDDYSWPNVRTRDKRPTIGNLDSHKDVVDLLPESWLTVSLSISDETGNLIVSKFTNNQHPFILNLPLSRHNVRDADEETYSFETEFAKLREIIEQSNLTAHISTTSEIKSKEDRNNWWRKRFALDKELEGLLENMEYRWLGGFKGVMSSWVIDKSLSAKFQDSVIASLNRNLPSRSGGKATAHRGVSKRGKKNDSHRVSVDPQVFELFLGLGHPDQFTDPSLLEDLIYFVLDILQFHGEQNAYDELDIDQIMVDIEEALRVYHNGYRQVEKQYNHIVLVLDKKCQQFPWESIPLLRDRSVSRVASLGMLKDLLERKESFKFDNDISYILNPGKDLTRTQERLEGTLSEIRGATGIVGQAPSEDEFADVLEKKQLLIYVGHGGGEQYIRGSRIKRLNRCCPALLLGCSSGSLELAGDYESWGTPVNFMSAGCPMLVANMWDVTDKDIDKFSVKLLELMGLVGERQPLDIGKAVAEARKECMLRYLNGAAPLIYGLPAF